MSNFHQIKKIVYASSRACVKIEIREFKQSRDLVTYQLPPQQWENTVLQFEECKLN